MKITNYTIAFFFLLSTFTFAQTDSFWLQGDGSWSSAGNWDNGVPDGWFTANIMEGSGQITQDMADLQLAGLVVDSSTANLILDQSLSITDFFVFNKGNITGQSDLNLLSGANALLNGPAVFSGEGDNGGGTFRIQGTATINDAFTSDGFFELSGASAQIAGNGTLTLNNSFTWAGGTMTGDGITQLNQGALISDGILDRTVENRAGLIVAGNGLTGTRNAVWHNISGDAVFKISGDQSLVGDGTFYNGDGAFLKKSGGTGTSIIEWDVFHEGNMILVEQGELSFRGDTYLNGQLMVFENGSLDFSGNTEFGPNVSHGDIGTLKISGGIARFDHTYDGHLDTVLTGTSTILGSGDINFYRDLNATTTTINGTGKLSLYGDSQFSIVELNRTTNNFGNADLSNSLITANSGNFTNRNGGVLNFSGFNNAFTGNGQFTNESGGQVSTSSGSNSWISWDFQNNGEIGVGQQSTLSFRNDFHQNPYGSLYLDNATVEFREANSTNEGRLMGTGTIDTYGNEIVVDGIVEPGVDIGTLQFKGNVAFTDDTEFLFELGSEMTSDLIQVSGDLNLDGNLNIYVLGDIPTGDYTLFTYDGQLFDSGLELSLPGFLKGSLFHNAVNRTIGLNVTSVPEPSAAVMCAILIIFCCRHDRRKNDSLVLVKD